MDTYFGIPVAALTRVLAAVLAGALLVVAVLAWRRRLLLRLALRNIPRRRTQTALIVLGLMLGTMLISCALATGDTMTGTLQAQLVQFLGRADEVASAPGHAFFPYRWYTDLQAGVRRDADVAGLVPAIDRDGVVIADMTSRQIDSNVALLGIPIQYSPAFGRLTDSARHPVSLAALAPGEVYANARLADDLAAAGGHRLYIFIDGKRLGVRLRGVVANGGLTGTQPALLLSLRALQGLQGRPRQINEILVANAGSPAAAVARSDTVAGAIQSIPVGNSLLGVDEVKQSTTQTVQNAQDVFSRLFTLFTLLAVAVSLLLIFLVFTLLAAERRSEMGVARALGVQRGGLIATFIFEGAAYDLAAALVGVAAGIGLGTLAIGLINGVVSRLGVHITFTMTGRSMLLAYCLGALSTLLAVLISSWWISRLNPVTAIRNLPDAPRFDAGIWSRLRALLSAILRLLRIRRRGPFGQGVVAAALALVWSLAARGILLEPLGLWLAQAGYDEANVTVFSAGVSLVAIATGLLVRWLLRLLGLLWNPLGRWADRAGFTVAGLGLLAYWVLPYDVLYDYGVPRFDGAIEVFFLAGLMMVAGAVWVTIYNIGLLLRPLMALLALLGRAPVALRTALAYPLHYKFRSGMTLAMFALVIFSLTVMAILSNAAQQGSGQSPADLAAMGNGFPIQAQTVFTPIDHIERDMAASPYVRPSEFSAVGTQSYQQIGVIQLSAPQPRWTVYAASVVNRGFLRGANIRLSTRARGYASDRAVWQAVADHPGLAVIDSGAVLSQGGYAAQLPIAVPPGAPVFTLSGVHAEDATMAPTPVWIAVAAGGRATRVTIIGVIDSRAYQTYGLFVNAAALAAAGVPAATPTSYYFQPRPGLDVERERRRIESAFLDHGLVATVTGDEMLREEAPRLLGSGMMEAYLGLTLVMGVIALGLVAARSVVERRGQIGMLRALGYGRSTVAASLLIEAGFVALLGSIIGIALGLVLCRNLFAANFFEQYRTQLGTTFAVSWGELGAVVLVACAAALLTTLIPAWQAARVAPAEALRAA